MIDPQALLEFAARQHPVAVHFPIALVISGALLELLICLHRREDWLIAQRFCLRFGAMMGLVAAFLGWSLAESVEASGELNLHRWLGVAAGVGMLITAYLVPRWPESERRVFRWALTLTTMAVALAGHFGGYLVHGADHFGL